MHNDKLNGLVLKELQAAGKGGGLAGIEIIDGVVLADEEWTAANVKNSMIPFRKDVLLTKAVGLNYGCTKDQPESDPTEVPERG